MLLDEGEGHFDWSHSELVRSEVGKWYVEYSHLFCKSETSVVRSIVHKDDSVVSPVSIVSVEHFDELEHEEEDGLSSVGTSVGCVEDISIRRNSNNERHLRHPICRCFNSSHSLLLPAIGSTVSCVQDSLINVDHHLLVLVKSLHEKDSCVLSQSFASVSIHVHSHFVHSAERHLQLVLEDSPDGCHS